MRSLPRSSATAHPRLAAALRRWLAAALAASALVLTAAGPAAGEARWESRPVYGAAQSSGPLADSLEVAAATNEDKDGDGFRDEDPSQPWPLYVIAAVVAGVAIFVTYKLVGPALRRRE